MRNEPLLFASISVVVLIFISLVVVVFLVMVMVIVYENLKGFQDVGV